MIPNKTLREQVWEANMNLSRSDLIIHTFGNVSGFDPDRGIFAIKPSGVLYEELRPDDMVIVDLNGKVMDGKLRPSSDTKTHSVLYRHFPDIGGICHTHSPYATSWAQATKAIPILGTTHADHLPLDIPCTEVMTDSMIQGDYETETGNQILQTFQKLSYKEVEMVLVAYHGPFTWGSSPNLAVYNSVILEEIARMAFLTLTINPKVDRLKQSLIDKHYFRKHGKNSYYGQDK